MIHPSAVWGRFYARPRAAASDELQQANRLSLGDSTQVIASLGHAFARSGRRPEAQRALATLNELSTHSYVSPYDLAIVYAGLGDKENALIWLGKAYDDRCGWLPLWLKVDPKFDSLRSDPRFAALLRRIGFSTQNVLFFKELRPLSPAKSSSGFDRLLECRLRAVARLADWEGQKQRFQALREQLSL